MRNYKDAPFYVKALYWSMHCTQTVEMVSTLNTRILYTNSYHLHSIREMFELGKTLIDTSDPDAQFPQSIHWIQTALRALEAKEGSSTITAAFIHDMGKAALHYFHGITGPFNWGDTFIVGCRHDVDAIETVDAAPGAFELNPDSTHELYSTSNGMYEEGCGLDKLVASFGHDEAIYQCVIRNMEKFKQDLPQADLDFLRWHSCYPIHTGTPKKMVGYEHLLAPGDLERMKIVKDRCRFDLYSKKIVVDPEGELYSRAGEIFEHIDQFIDPSTKLCW